MMPEAGFIFSTESPTLLNSKDTKGGCGEGIHGKKNGQVIPLRSQAMGNLGLGGIFFCTGKETKDDLGTLSALSLEKQLPDLLHFPRQKPAPKKLQGFAVPLGFALVSPAGRSQA